MHNIALDYLSSFGMKAGINYTSYHSESHQQFTNKDNKNQTSEFHTTSGQTIDRWKIYVDQSHTLPREWTLNYGTSLTYASDHNTQFYHTQNGTDMSELNTNNRYNEYTYDFYVGYSRVML